VRDLFAEVWVRRDRAQAGENGRGARGAA
jgi:hypothetical protein